MSAEISTEAPLKLPGYNLWLESHIAKTILKLAAVGAPITLAGCAVRNLTLGNTNEAAAQAIASLAYLALLGAATVLNRRISDEAHYSSKD